MWALRPLRRVRTMIAWSGLVTIALVVPATWRWVVSPSSTEPDEIDSADAVVMFVGGEGERLETAIDLIDRGVAPVLVIPNGTVATWPQGNALCAGSFDFEVVCPTPDPNNTRGEARVLAELANERGWDTLAMVTSTYHVSRAHLRLDRCFEGEIVAVAASRNLSLSRWLSHAAHELAGHAEARIAQRSC